MRHGLTFLISLSFACSSVSTMDPGGGSADAPPGGAADAGAPDAPPNVIEDLIGVWDITAEEDSTGCTATFTDGILIECTNDPQTTSEAGCLRQSTMHITGSWFADLALDLQEADDFSGTCADPAHVDSMRTFATMTGRRTMVGTASGLWDEAGGQWEVEAIDPATPEDGAQITCTASFTPSDGRADVNVTCATPWRDEDSDGCERRATHLITAVFVPGSVTIQLQGQDEAQGVSCTPPLVEPWEVVNLSATKR